MKYAIIFRGENERMPNNGRNYIDAIMCWDNWKKTILDDLVNNGHTCDIIFITYPSNIIEQIKNVINPKYLILNDKINQTENFKNVCNFMTQYTNDYDRFIILRCDFKYRFPITKWPKWNENGIFIVNRDAHWPSQKLYADIVFMVDTYMLSEFINAYYIYIYATSMHAIGRNLLNNNIPFILMYDGYYHMDSHPLHALASVEPDPDLNNPIIMESISDISQWN